jgi:hypothetical protein
MIEPMRTRRLTRWLFGLSLMMAMCTAPRLADAHGIAGNRFFPGTLAFDDPAVADESRLPLFSAPSIRAKAAMSSIKGSAGRSFAC